MVTRRCTQRQFLLRPDPVTEQVLTFCLGLAAERHGIEVFCFAALSNHVLRDPKGLLPRFMAHFDSLVARALNCHHHRGENFWAPGSYSAVSLEDDDAVLDKIVYMITNPIAANLVDLPDDWPGLLTLAQDVGRRELVARRPTFFCRQPHAPDDEADDTAAGRARRRYPPRDLTPDEVRLRLTRPPGFHDLDDDALRALVARRVAAGVDELHEQHRREGRGPALGRDAVLLQRPTDAPGSSASGFRLNPTLGWPAATAGSAPSASRASSSSGATTTRPRSASARASATSSSPSAPGCIASPSAPAVDQPRRRPERRQVAAPRRGVALHAQSQGPLHRTWHERGEGSSRMTAPMECARAA